MEAVLAEQAGSEEWKIGFRLEKKPRVAIVWLQAKSRVQEWFRAEI